MISPEYMIVRSIRTKSQYSRNLSLTRSALEKAFSAETSYCEVKDSYQGGSHGHCAAVAIILYFMYGGHLKSTMINGVSHWYNWKMIDNVDYDIDLTADQFGYAPLYFTEHQLYFSWRERFVLEANLPTIRRAALLAKRAELDPSRQLMSQLNMLITQKEEALNE